MIHREMLKWAKVTNVVNCFQNCIFINDSQANLPISEQARGCELLSKLYFH